MTDVEKIRAEIERRFKENKQNGYYDISDELDGVLSFIDSMQEDSTPLTKENSTSLSGEGRADGKEMPVSEELEEAVKIYTASLVLNGEGSDLTVGQLKGVADKCFKAGTEWKKQRMIENVLEFFENDLCCYIKAQDFTIEHKRLEIDFKKYIEGK
jgi:hypothetical protein